MNFDRVVKRSWILPHSSHTSAQQPAAQHPSPWKKSNVPHPTEPEIRKLLHLREWRVTSGANRSTAGRRQRHAGREFPQAEGHESGDENQAGDEGWREVGNLSVFGVKSNPDAQPLTSGTMNS